MKAFRKRFCCVHTDSQCFKHFVKTFSTVGEVSLKGAYPFRHFPTVGTFRITEKVIRCLENSQGHTFWKCLGAGWCMHDFYVIHNNVLYGVIHSLVTLGEPHSHDKSKKNPPTTLRHKRLKIVLISIYMLRECWRIGRENLSVFVSCLLEFSSFRILMNAPS